MKDLPDRDNDTPDDAEERYQASKLARAKAFVAYDVWCKEHGESNSDAAKLWQTWQHAIEWSARCLDRCVALALDARNRSSYKRAVRRVSRG